jgi:hypothetical protein
VEEEVRGETSTAQEREEEEERRAGVQGQGETQGVRGKDGLDEGEEGE